MIKVYNMFEINNKAPVCFEKAVFGEMFQPVVHIMNGVKILPGSMYNYFSFLLRDRWTHLLRGEVRHVSRDGEASAEQYRLTGRERYDLEGPHYLFGFARWEKDRFSGYDHQLAAIAGYGRELIRHEHHRLSLEAGPGYRHDRIDTEPNASLGVAYGALAWQFEASETTTLKQELSVEATDDNTTSRALSSLTARLNSRLALRLSHEIRRNSQPPEEADARTDHTTSASLLYSW